MRPLLLSCLFALTAAGAASSAESPSATQATDYLALRGGSRETAGGMAGETEFNAFRRAAAGADFSRSSPGYLVWKNTCRPVARMAAGGSFEFAGGGGFADVAPYVLLPEPTAAGWLELLAAEFSLPAGKRGAGRK